VVRQNLQLARCGYTLRVTPQTLMIVLAQWYRLSDTVGGFQQGRRFDSYPTAYSCIFHNCSWLGLKIVYNLPLEIPIHKTPSTGFHLASSREPRDTCGGG
jgi:hypothetical protein